jgi:DNA-binding winged helix-turn-helix (wHTH) protein
MMREQGSYSDPHPGNFQLSRQADNGNGSDCHDRSNDPIVDHWEGSPRKAHTQPYETSGICADDVTSAPEAYLAGASREAVEFGRFRVLLRQRQLLADGLPIALGTRALDLLLVLLQADGSLVTKDELLSRVWPDVVVAEDNLKVQVSALRRALGEDRDFIRTEFGRGYRFTAAVRSTVAWTACRRTTRRGRRSNQRSVANGFLGDRRTVRIQRSHWQRLCSSSHRGRRVCSAISASSGTI